MSSKMRVLAGLFSLLLMMAGQQITWGQSGAGSIQGTVADSTGAVIPGASIHVVNNATSEAFDTKSNGVGFYQVPDLFTGRYAVTFTAPGMKTYKTSIELLVAQSAVINPVLTPGAVSQQVIVSGNAVQLTTTDNGTVTSDLENARINQLPMNVRLLTTLIGETTPGIVMQSGTEPHVDGMALESLEFTIDGATTSNDFYGGPYNQKVASIDPDAVQEVTMETSSSGAQYSSPATGIISTKSGTNQLHGTFFETARNNAIGVAKDRQDPSIYSAPHLVRNEFGLSAGGPIILPHVYHGKDRSFWFFAYERYSYATSLAGLYKVPTVAMRTGDFSGLINSSGVLQTLFDPSTTASSTNCPYTNASNAYCRTAFNDNQIPLGEISPTAKIYYQLLPQPTTTADPLVTTNLTALNDQLQLLPQETFRLDHEFNQNNRAYLRFSNEISNTNTGGAPRSLAVGSIPTGAAEGYTNGPLGTMTAAIGYTHIFSPTFFAETIASQEWFFFSTNTGNEANLNYEAMLGLPNNFGETGFPALGNGTLINNLTASQSNKHESQRIFTLNENLTKVVGRNQMLFGAYFQQHRGVIQPAGINDTIPSGADPTALYNPSTGANYVSLANTGYADASFFLGSANSYGITHQAFNVNYLLSAGDGYFQDNYHMSRNLTVNLGVRYEAHPAPKWAKYNLVNSFDLKNDAMVFPVPISTLISEGYVNQA
ncbi:MAG: carboxypeptidase regulatory-like domain-containing protein, partial [Terriglobia bacterium]